ncbi:uncharacterized protein LOC126902447 [Daktulosphaira vitifoliae]|uniref:uncharacterized protein LOC126902447 n=1 Tax=Daktulosphaira vitifoliae TaxID=58002 RepID=UPI0021AA2707|nr:uncharacterized protein LOC126902447 [Daktulosphaira vitifoliae]
MKSYFIIFTLILSLQLKQVWSNESVFERSLDDLKHAVGNLIEEITKSIGYNLESLVPNHYEDEVKNDIKNTLRKIEDGGHKVLKDLENSLTPEINNLIKGVAQNLYVTAIKGTRFTSQSLLKMSNHVFDNFSKNNQENFINLCHIAEKQLKWLRELVKKTNKEYDIEKYNRI